MKFQDEAYWVLNVSPHTNARKTAICLPRPRNCYTFNSSDGTILGVLGGESVGGVYQVTGENGEGSPGSIEVLSIAAIDVRHTLLNGHIHACGYSSLRDFLIVWAYRYDTEWYEARVLCKKLRANSVSLQDLLRSRPGEKYRAWLITFRPVA